MTVDEVMTVLSVQSCLGVVVVVFALLVVPKSCLLSCRSAELLALGSQVLGSS